MAGLANNNNPFQSQVRLGTQYIQLVPGPPGPAGVGGATIDNNGVPVAPEPVLNFIGFGFSDTPGVSTNITAPTGVQPAPGTTISGTATINAVDTFKLIQPSLTPYVITMGSILPGILYRMLTVAGSLGGFAATPCTISRGSNTFHIEDPQNRYAFAGTETTQLLKVDGVCYEWCLDSTNNVLRCLRQVQ